MNSINAQLKKAAEAGQTKEVENLLQAGADIHTDDDYPITWAANYGQTETVKVLIQAGANWRQANHLPLTLAATNNRTETISALLKNYKTPELQDLLPKKDEPYHPFVQKELNRRRQRAAAKSRENEPEIEP